MKRELIKLLTERVALLAHHNETAIGFPDDVSYVMEAPAEDTVEQDDFEQEIEKMFIDFDFDKDNQSYFDNYMTLRYYWRDWNAVYTEVF